MIIGIVGPSISFIFSISLSRASLISSNVFVSSESRYLLKKYKVENEFLYLTGMYAISSSNLAVNSSSCLTILPIFDLNLKTKTAIISAKAATPATAALIKNGTNVISFKFNTTCNPKTIIKMIIKPIKAVPINSNIFDLLGFIGSL